MACGTRPIGRGDVHRVDRTGIGRAVEVSSDRLDHDGGQRIRLAALWLPDPSPSATSRWPKRIGGCSSSTRASPDLAIPPSLPRSAGRKQETWIIVRHTGSRRSHARASVRVGSAAVRGGRSEPPDARSADRLYRYPIDNPGGFAIDPRTLSHGSACDSVAEHSGRGGRLQRRSSSSV